MSWLDGMPKGDGSHIYIFDIAKKIKCSVRIDLKNDFLLSQLNIQVGPWVEHMVKFSKL
jgi:hypothetical protein